MKSIMHSSVLEFFNITQISAKFLKEISMNTIHFMKTKAALVLAASALLSITASACTLASNRPYAACDLDYIVTASSDTILPTNLNYYLSNRTDTNVKMSFQLVRKVNGAWQADGNKQYFTLYAWDLTSRFYPVHGNGEYRLHFRKENSTYEVSVGKR
jgi:hypothetical protein